MKTTVGAILIAFLVSVVVALIIVISYDAGQVAVIESCQHTSFFYHEKLVFECLPYTRGGFEIHPQVGAPPR